MACRCYQPTNVSFCTRTVVCNFENYIVNFGKLKVDKERQPQKNSGKIAAQKRFLAHQT